MSFFSQGPADNQDRKVIFVFLSYSGQPSAAPPRQRPPAGAPGGVGPAGPQPAAGDRPRQHPRAARLQPGADT